MSLAFTDKSWKASAALPWRTASRASLAAASVLRARRQAKKEKIPRLNWLHWQRRQEMSFGSARFVKSCSYRREYNKTSGVCLLKIGGWGPTPLEGAAALTSRKRSVLDGGVGVAVPRRGVGVAGAAGIEPTTLGLEVRSSIR